MILRSYLHSNVNVPQIQEKSYFLWSMWCGAVWCLCCECVSLKRVTTVCVADQCNWYNDCRGGTNQRFDRSWSHQYVLGLASSSFPSLSLILPLCSAALLLCSPQLQVSRAVTSSNTTSVAFWKVQTPHTHPYYGTKCIAPHSTTAEAKVCPFMLLVLST